MQRSMLTKWSLLAVSCSFYSICPAFGQECCYSSLKDCDDAKNFCSKDVQRCTECGGHFYGGVAINSEGQRCCWADAKNCDAPDGWCSMSRENCDTCSGKLLGPEDKSDRSGAAQPSKAAQLPAEQEGGEPVPAPAGRPTSGASHASMPTNSDESPPSKPKTPVKPEPLVKKPKHEAHEPVQAPTESPTSESSHASTPTNSDESPSSKPRPPVKPEPPEKKPEQESREPVPAPTESPTSGSGHSSTPTNNDESPPSKLKPPVKPKSPVKSRFPRNLDDIQCYGLERQTASSADQCEQACASDSSCGVWQWCAEGGSCSPVNSCWVGAAYREHNCEKIPGSHWISGGVALPAVDLVAKIGDGQQRLGAATFYLASFAVLVASAFAVSLWARRVPNDMSQPLIGDDN